MNSGVRAVFVDVDEHGNPRQGHTLDIMPETRESIEQKVREGWILLWYNTGSGLATWARPVTQDDK